VRPNAQYNQDGRTYAILRQGAQSTAQDERTRPLLHAQDERAGSGIRTAGERSRILGLDGPGALTPTLSRFFDT